jgi:hypothetical protein
MPSDASHFNLSMLQSASTSLNATTNSHLVTHNDLDISIGSFHYCCSCCWPGTHVRTEVTIWDWFPFHSLIWSKSRIGLFIAPEMGICDLFCELVQNPFWTSCSSCLLVCDWNYEVHGRAGALCALMALRHSSQVRTGITVQNSVSRNSFTKSITDSNISAINRDISRQGRWLHKKHPSNSSRFDQRKARLLIIMHTHFYGS